MLSKELLERFKRGEVVFHTPTQEIYNKAIIDVKQYGCVGLDSSIYSSYREGTCITNRTIQKMSYGDIDCYEESYPELEIITLKLSDFDSETKEIAKVIPLDIQEKLMGITRVITLCRKLEKTYNTDLCLNGLLDVREKILKELEDSLAIHI